ncbi:la-related protein 1C isoform X2 [Citrus sinensis]|uniref:la-related protein 1C isoform X2 n=1 Tax=Citrus sinensis TaxID=2711 RepID=UPI000D62F8BF|nr:la-related protein 1C isoform X2 [Citrus sinensis]
MATASNITNSNFPSIDNSVATGSGQPGGPWPVFGREPIALVSSSSSQSTSVIELAAAAAAAADEDNGAECGNGNAGSKRPPWNRQPSNGAAEMEPVMGAHSWPALSETTRGSSSSTKSSSDSLKGLVDGSSSSSSVLQPPASQGSVVEGRSNNPSPRDHTQKSGFGSQFHGGNDHPHPRGSFKHRNGNQHPRGDGSHHHNYGGRRDQDRGNQDWNSHRNYSGRDAHMQPQRVVQRFTRHPPPPPPPPPPSSSPFIPPPPVRPFGSPIGFPEFASPVYYVAAAPPEALRGVPFVAPIPPHAVFFPAPDPQLHSRIVTQIDYYFSNENLVKDTFLRQNMDDQGWVPIRLIAGFNKVSLLTDNIQLILDALRSSTVVEVQGDRIRKRNDWMRWIMPPGKFSSLPSPQSQGKSGIDMLSAQVQSISLDQKTLNHSRSSSGDLSNLSPTCSSAGKDQVSI